MPDAPARRPEVHSPSVVAVAIALACASVAGPARAQAPSAGSAALAEREAQRKALYHDAAEAAGAGHWAEARERLRAVLAIRPSPKVFFSLAQAEEQLGQVASAQADYARSIEGAATAGEGDVVQAAGQAQRALAPRVPHVRALVSGTEPGASATLDDQPIALGTPVAADPGEHRLVVSAPGKRTATASVTVAEGQLLDVPVSLSPEQGAIPVATQPVARAAETPATSGASPWRTVGLISAGAGVVALGVGAVFGGVSLSKHNDAQNACPGATCPDANGSALWHDAVTAGNVSTVAFVIGGVALVGGAVLWLAAPRSDKPSATSPQVGFGLGSVQVRGAW